MSPCLLEQSTPPFLRRVKNQLSGPECSRLLNLDKPPTKCTFITTEARSTVYWWRIKTPTQTLQTLPPRQRRSYAFAIFKREAPIILRNGRHGATSGAAVTPSLQTSSDQPKNCLSTLPCSKVLAPLVFCGGLGLDLFKVWRAPWLPDRMSSTCVPRSEGSGLGSSRQHGEFWYGCLWSFLNLNIVGIDAARQRTCLPMTLTETRVAQPGGGLTRLADGKLGGRP